VPTLRTCSRRQVQAQLTKRRISTSRQIFLP